MSPRAFWAEFTTPRELADLVARLVSPKEGDHVCDPNCGTGELLASIARLEPTTVLSGQTSLPNLVEVCRQTLSDLNAEAQIECGDLIIDPQFVRENELERFDILVSTPPLAKRCQVPSPDPWNRFHRSEPSPHESSWLYLSHMIEATKPGGRAAAVLPTGALFRGGPGERMRRPFIEENLLDGVVALPPALLPGTSIPTCIVLLRRDKPDESVLFIDARTEPTAGRATKRLEQSSADRIALAWHNRKTEERFSDLATPDELRANDWDLSVHRYVNTVEEFTFDADELRAKLEILDSELSVTRSRLDDALEALTHEGGQS